MEFIQIDVKILGLITKVNILNKVYIVKYWNLEQGVVHKWRHGLKGRGYQGFCDDSTKALVIKSATMGEGVSKNYQLLRDVIYGH